MSYLSGPGAGDAVTLSRTGVVDRNPIVIQKVSGQSGPLLQCIDVDGVTVLAQIGADGLISGGSSLAGAVILAPATAGRNTIQPTADNVEGLVIKPHSATVSAYPLQVQNSAGATRVFMSGGENSLAIIAAENELGGTIFRAEPSTGIAAVIVNSVKDSQVAFVVVGNSGTTTADLFQAQEGFNGNPVFGVSPSNASGTTSQIYQAAGAADTSNPVRIIDFAGSLPNANQATYTSREVISMVDNAGTRECLRMEADGTNPRIGMLGAAAVVRQAGASAAGIGLVVDANAKAALTALQAALAAYGLVTSPA